MKRLLIFTMLFPPLVLVVYVVADQLLFEGIPGFTFLASLLGVSYVLAVIPAWLTAGVDWMLSPHPFLVRLIATMAVGATLAELVASYLGQPHFDGPVALAGALPAAACSWLSDIMIRGTAVSDPSRRSHTNHVN